MSNRNTELTIGYNNCAANDPCALCGKRTDPAIPLAIFPRGNWQPVCDHCAREQAPELALVLRHFYGSMEEMIWVARRPRTMRFRGLWRAGMFGGVVK